MSPEDLRPLALPSLILLVLLFSFLITRPSGSRGRKWAFRCGIFGAALPILCTILMALSGGWEGPMTALMMIPILPVAMLVAATVFGGLGWVFSKAIEVFRTFYPHVKPTGEDTPHPPDA